MNGKTRSALYRQKKKIRKIVVNKHEASKYLSSLDNLNNNQSDSLSDCSENGSGFDYYRDHGSDSSTSSKVTVSEDQDVHQELCDASACEIKEVQQIIQWTVDTKTPHTHVNRLLNILQPRLLPSLPLCTKTLLRNNVKCNPDAMAVSDGSVGEFYHFGIKDKLKLTVNPKFHETNLLELIINIDGISPFTSSKVTMWPILCQVYSKKNIYKPFTASVFAGHGKPKNAAEYLDQFVQEVNVLQRSGVRIDKSHLEVRTKFFSCDTPTRSFIRGSVGHSAFKACERCKVIGEKVNKVTVFLQSDAEKKTDDDFRSFEDPDHHTGPSLLTSIHPPINMLDQFILDPMHLIYLGCTNRVLEYLLKSTSKHKVCLSSALKDELNRRSMEIQKDIPEEFPRKMRPTKDYANYKAVEFKFFLLYAGIFLLKKLVSKEVYNHFLLFSISCRLLSERDPLPFIQEARQNLNKFVDDAATIYGPTFISLNVYNLIHVADDIESTQLNLQEISAFPFESYLGKMTSLLRSPKHLVSQYAKRVFELEKNSNEMVKIPEDIEILKQKKKQIMKIKYKGIILSTVHPNNTVLLENKNIAEIIAFHSSDNIIFIRYKTYLNKVEVLSNSSLLNIWEIKKLSSDDLVAPINNISKKFIKFNISLSTTEEKRQFVIPFLHYKIGISVPGYFISL